MLSNPNEMKKKIQSTQKKMHTQRHKQAEKKSNIEDMYSDTVYLLHKNLCSNIEYKSIKAKTMHHAIEYDPLSAYFDYIKNALLISLALYH